jgi:hypothetical protein
MLLTLYNFPTRLGQYCTLVGLFVTDVYLGNGALANLRKQSSRSFFDCSVHVLFIKSQQDFFVPKFPHTQVLLAF